MREVGNLSAAALFERMVLEEREHERKLVEWMTRESLAEQTDIGPLRWRDPMVLTIYNDDARERRLAFHAERDTSAGSAADPRTIQNEMELLASTIQIDRYLSDAISKIDTNSRQLAALARETRQQISNNEEALNSLAPDYREFPSMKIPMLLAQAEPNEAMTEDSSGSLGAQLQRFSIYCDQSFAFYDTIVESTSDESMMRTAQTLTLSALDRIGILKQVTGAG